MRYGKQPSFARVDVTQRFNFVALWNRYHVGHSRYIQTDQLRFTRLSEEQKAVEVTSSFDAEKSNGVNNEPASVRYFGVTKPLSQTASASSSDWILFPSLQGPSKYHDSGFQFLLGPSVDLIEDNTSGILCPVLRPPNQ